jgi:SAM-dependent methyltransferase
VSSAEKDLLRWMLARFPSARSVLEVGCGTAHFTRWLEPQRLVVGLERSAAMLREARRLRTEGPLSRAAGVRLVGVVARSSVYPRRLCSLRTWIPLGDVLGVSARLR